MTINEGKTNIEISKVVRDSLNSLRKTKNFRGSKLKVESYDDVLRRLLKIG
jgi:hypothetical protein